MINQPRAAVRITYIKWRAARPRFEPGPSQTKLGFKGYDLKHPDGRWFTYEEAVAESARIHAETMARRKAAASEGQATEGHAPRRKAEGAAAPGFTTLGQLCEAVFDHQALTSETVVIGRKVRKGLRRSTVAFYMKAMRSVRATTARMAAEKQGADLWHIPAARLTPPLANAIIHHLEVQSGLASARAARAFLSMTWTRMAQSCPGLDLALWKKIERLDVPAGRIRPWTPDEFWHMLATADRMGLPHMGDMMALGALHGAHQNDRVAAHWPPGASHISMSVNSKTGVEVVAHLVTGFLARRLEAARQRRKAMTVQYPHAVMDEAAGTPWSPACHHYRKVFARVRAEAARALPSCATLRDQDLRDTNQSWLYAAGADPRVMQAIAGHAPERELSAMQKRHYVQRHQAAADAAVAAITRWIEQQQPAADERQG